MDGVKSGKIAKQIEFYSLASQNNKML